MPDGPPPADAGPPTVTTPSPVGQPASRWRNGLFRLIVLLVAGGLAVLFTTQWNRWVGDATRQVTDDAYIHGDVTPLSAQVEGYVRKVAVDDFQRVKAGDLLVEIDDQDYAAKVAQAEADLLGAQAAIENIKARKAAQKAVVVEAESAVTGTQADAERAKLEAQRQRKLLASTFGTEQKVEQTGADATRLAALLELDDTPSGFPVGSGEDAVDRACG